MLKDRHFTQNRIVSEIAVNESFLAIRATICTMLRPHAAVLALFSVVIISGVSCSRLENSFNTALEEEKSYTRHAMEYHRQHPEKRRGDLVLEVWSTADYIAQSVIEQHSVGDWAATSDQLAFLPDRLKRMGGKPFCVIQRSDVIEVVWYFSGPEKCNLQSNFNASLSRIASGDMEFSGRTDYWIYILRRGRP